jgi:hypothetical protein
MIRHQQNRSAGTSMSKPKDAFAKFRHCGCLSCEIITLVLDRQPETCRASWNTHEMLHTLSEASAFFCKEILAHGGDTVHPAEDLHALVMKKIGVPQHGPASVASAPAQSPAPDGATIH